MPSRVFCIIAQISGQHEGGEADDDDAVVGQHGRQSSMPPDIHDGLATSTFCAPKITRAAWISISDRPQVASRFPAGGRRARRITVRSMQHADQRGSEKAAGIAASRYQSSWPGEVAAEHALHHARWHRRRSSAARRAAMLMTPITP
jgi:hypothetical protein